MGEEGWTVTRSPQIPIQLVYCVDDRLRAAKVYYDMAKCQTEQNNYDAVFKTYSIIVDPKSDATPNERADSHIWLGRILDSQNRRKEALKHYDAVLALDCDPEYKEQANDYKKRPFQAKA